MKDGSNKTKNMVTWNGLKSKELKLEEQLKNQVKTSLVICKTGRLISGFYW